MADGGYYEPYAGMDSSGGIMPSMSGYRGHGGTESYGELNVRLLVSWTSVADRTCGHITSSAQLILI